MDDKSVNECEITGNTKSDFTINNNNKQYVNWVFTLNNYTIDDPGIILNFCEKKCKKWVFQEELGEQGTPHLQGFISLKKTSRLTSLKKVNERIHWEVCKMPECAWNYCQKEETRNGKIWCSEVIRKPIKILKDEDLYNWEKQIMDWISDPPNDRQIIWVKDSEGGKGKSTFCKYLVVKKGAMLCGGSSKDMFCALKLWVEKKDYPEIVVIDVARSGDIDYEGIEQIKNGLVFNSKYEAQQIVGNPPHVIVFSNYGPRSNALSKDRIIEIVL